MEWSFIRPCAAWHGGMWERLIGMTKSTQSITQIEAKLNNRPLTYLSSDVKDFQPLTPSQLFVGFKLKEFPNQMEEEELSDPSFSNNY